MGPLQVFQVYSIIVMTISVTLCLIVITISYRLHKKSRNDYSWIIGFNTTIDLFFSITYGLCMVTTSTKYPYLYVFTHSPLFSTSNPMVIRIIIVFRLSIAIIDSPLTAIHFWYRYNVMCNRTVWSWKTYCKVYSVFILSTVFQAINMMFDAIDGQVPLDVEDINTSSARYIYFAMDTKWFIFGLIHSQIQPLVEYYLICYFGWKIYRNLKKLATRSINTTQAAQNTLVKVMALQAIYPLILHFIPVVFILFCIMINVQFESSASFVMGAPMHLTPILSAISILTMMPSYRRVIRNEKSSVLAVEYTTNNWTTTS